MIRIFTLLPLAAVLVATPAVAQQALFSSEDLATAAQAEVARLAPDLPAQRAVAARTERLRATLAVAQAAMLAGEWSADEQLVLASAFGPPTAERDLLLGWLMRGGHVAVGSAELAGIYNPFADGWLVLRWSAVGGVPRLTQAALVQGALVRGQALPRGGAPDAPFAQALVARRVNAPVAFAALTGLGSERFLDLYAPLRIGQAEAVMAAARVQVGALAQWSRENAAGLSHVNRTIARGEDLAVLALPARLRDQLGPIAVAETPQGTEVVLQSPVYPARGLVAAFAHGDQTPELFALDLAPSAGSAAR